MRLRTSLSLPLSPPIPPPLHTNPPPLAHTHGQHTFGNFGTRRLELSPGVCIHRGQKNLITRQETYWCAGGRDLLVGPVKERPTNKGKRDLLTKAEETY